MTQAVRAEVGDKAKCSVTLNLQFNRGDADACHRLDLISNRAFLDPMLRGRYPDELFSITKGICDWDFIQSGDLELIHQPIDVLGINYYSTNRVAMSDRPQFPQSTEASTAPGASDVDWLPTEGPHTDMGWNIDPDGLHDLLVRVHDNYPEVDLVVTENGMACKDQLTVNEDGTKSVHDPDRIDSLERHFAAAKRAIDEGLIAGPRIYPQLRERSYGVAEGMTIEEYLERFGAFDRENVPEAESTPHLRARAVSAARRVVRDARRSHAPQDVPVIAVAHGALIGQLIRHASGDTLPLAGERLANASTHTFLVERDRLGVLSYAAVPVD